MSRDLNGSTDEIALGDMAVVEGLSALSMACWVNLDTLGNTEPFFSKFNAAANDGVYFGLSNSTGGGNDDLLALVRGPTGTDGQAYTTGNIITTGSWLHVAFTYDGAGPTIELFFNGVAQATTMAGTTPATTPANTSVARLGQTDFPTRMDGKITEFGIWQRVLTDDEIAALADGYTATFFPRNLVSYLPLIRDVFDRYGAAAITDDSDYSALMPNLMYPGPLAIWYAEAFVPPVTLWAQSVM